MRLRRVAASRQISLIVFIVKSLLSLRLLLDMQFFVQYRICDYNLIFLQVL
jgi:hypothetical protein